MSQIPEEIIERIRDAVDIVELIGEHVQLKRSGADYRGPCPFHGGTHRNFSVIPKKEMFYCFVCHEGGDVFTFLMKKFGMDYPTAVRDVAQRVGITIPERSTGGPDPREPLFSAVAVAHEWFQRQLRESEEAAPARSYLERRRFPLDSLLPHGLGFAPRGNAFLSAMGTLGIEDDVLLSAGLALRRDEGALRARFWQRLLFPIHDLRGRVVGFGGRVIGAGEPKYVNSPESEIFYKGRLLYNIHNARHPIRKAEQAIVVEGYFDVLRLVETGIENVVAPLGTGFTVEQAQLLRRLAPSVTLLFDSDAAGLRATFRTADELLRAGMAVMVATMPSGEDPDTLIAGGGVGAIESVLHDTIDVFERKLQLLERKGWLGTLAGRRRALDRLLPTLRAAADPVTRDLYVTRVSELLGISRESVTREIADRPDRQPIPRGAPESAGKVRPRPRTRRPGPERDLLRVMIQEPQLRRRIAELVPDQTVLREPDATLFRSLIELPESDPATALQDTVAGEALTLLAELLNEGSGPPDIDAVVTGAVNKLDSQLLERELSELERRIPLAAEEEKPALAQRVGTLSREIARLNPGRWNVIRRRRRSAS